MKYPSRYSPGKSISAAQYITELICEKKAYNQGSELPIKFWTLPEWGRFYKQQILAANSLLRIYSAKAIIAALNSKDTKYIFSLRAPQLDAIIEREQKAIKEIEVKEKIIEVKVEKPRPTISNNNILNRLRKLE